MEKGVLEEGAVQEAGGGAGDGRRGRRRGGLDRDRERRKVRSGEGLSSFFSKKR